MVKNRFKERVTECAFDNEPLRKVYEMICNLETPYIWYADSFSGEQLYLINDLETEEITLEVVDCIEMNCGEDM